MRELSLNVMDIAQNSITAGAGLITVTVEEDAGADRLTIQIADNGCGMTPEQVRNVTDPFYTTRSTRKVGLGIPLFHMEAEMTGGSFRIDSEKGVGTTVTAVFVPSHVDMIPLGEIDATMYLLVTCNPDRDFLYIRRIDGREFRLDTRELREVLGEEVPFNDPGVSEWIKAYLEENTAAIMSGG